MAVAALLGAIFGIGVVAERRPGRSGFAAFFDTLLARLPGVGSLYRSIDELESYAVDASSHLGETVAAARDRTPVDTEGDGGDESEGDDR